MAGADHLQSDGAKDQSGRQLDAVTSLLSLHPHGPKLTVGVALVSIALVGPSARADAINDNCALSELIIESVAGHETMTLADLPELDQGEHAQLIQSERYDGPSVTRVFVDVEAEAVTTLSLYDARTHSGADRFARGAREGLLEEVDGWNDVTVRAFGPPPGAAWAFRASGLDPDGVARTILGVGGAHGRVGISLVAGSSRDAAFDADQQVALISTVYERQVDLLPSACLRAVAGPAIASELGELATAAVALWLALQGGASLLAGWQDAMTRRRWAARARHPFRSHQAPQPLPVGPGWIVRDVSRFAAARRERARLAGLARLAGVTLIGMSLAALTVGPPALLVLMPIGLVAPPLLYRLFRASAGDTGPEPARRIARPRGWPAVLLYALAAVAIGLLVVGLGAGLTYVQWSGMSQYERAVRAARSGAASLDAYEGTVGGFVFVGIGALLASGGLWRLARRLTMPGLHSVRTADPRPPVLFLRGFADDPIQMYMSQGQHRGLMERLSLRRRETFEELAAWTLSAYGPVIAVQNPRAQHRRLGAARESIHAEDWLAVVRDRMREATTIVLIVGNSPGLVAEVLALREDGLLTRCLFVLPPLDGAIVASRWDSIATALGRGPKLLAHDDGSTLIRVNETHEVLYRSTNRDDVGYQASVDQALEDERQTRSPVSSQLTPSP